MSSMTPERWAIKITNILRELEKHHADMPRIPIDVFSVAKELSRQIFPEEPITKIEGNNFGTNFDGMLIKIFEKNEWGIIYNQSITAEGRINFTLAHEFGHYLLHRSNISNEYKCSAHSQGDKFPNNIEAEADKFASSLLIPADDFRNQIHNKNITIALIKKLAERYRVSFTAAAIRLTALTSKRIMIVLGKDGFIHWAHSSDALFESRIFYQSRTETNELPSDSLAKKNLEKDFDILNANHPSGVWKGECEVFEETLFWPDSITFSLLTYPEEIVDVQEEETLDSYDHILKFTR